MRLASSLDSAAFRGPEHPTDDAFQDAARHEQIAILATTFGFLALIAGSLTAFCYFVRSPWAPAGATIECKGWAHGRPVDLERKRFPDLRLWHGGRRDVQHTVDRIALAGVGDRNALAVRAQQRARVAQLPATQWTEDRAVEFDAAVMDGDDARARSLQYALSLNSNSVVMASGQGDPQGCHLSRALRHGRRERGSMGSSVGLSRRRCIRLGRRV